MSNDEIADKLDEYATFLEIDGQTGKSHAYEKAARSIRMASYIPPDPARLDGIGPSTREAVIDLENGTGIDELEELHEKYDWYTAFKDIKHIGPSRAKEIHETLGVSSLDKLALVAKEGDLQLISGIGAATETKIKQSIAEQRE